MNSSQKWMLALVMGLLFVLISLPYTYQLTNMLFKHVHLDTVSSGESNLTMVGILIHFVVFTLLARLILHFY